MQRIKAKKADYRSTILNKTCYWNAIDSLDYLIETCSECDGEYVGGEIKLFIDNLYSLAGGNLNGQ